MINWKPIDTAERNGKIIRLLIPYNKEMFTEKESTDIGYWDSLDNCFRFVGDDGPDDIQPTHWDDL